MELKSRETLPYSYQWGNRLPFLQGNFLFLHEDCFGFIFFQGETILRSVVHIDIKRWILWKLVSIGYKIKHTSDLIWKKSRLHIWPKGFQTFLKGFVKDFCLPHDRNKIVYMVFSYIYSHYVITFSMYTEVISVYYWSIVQHLYHVLSLSLRRLHQFPSHNPHCYFQESPI